MSTFMCDVGAAVTRLLVRAYAVPTSETLAPMEILAGLLLVTAALLGVLSLLLLPVVLYVRQQRPPMAFMTFAVIAALAPFAALLLG